MTSKYLGPGKLSMGDYGRPQYSASSSRSRGQSSNEEEVQVEAAPVIYAFLVFILINKVICRFKRRPPRREVAHEALQLIKHPLLMFLKLAKHPVKFLGTTTP